MAEARSEPFQLNPGVDYQGRQLTECVVRLLPRSDRKLIAAIADLVEQDNQSLVRSIVRLGDVTDRNQIADAVEELLPPDEDRIRDELEALGSRFAAKVTAKDEVIAKLRIRRATDICSDPFELNPGLVIDNKAVTTCVVRLATRGDWKLIEAAASEEERGDLSLLHGIAQLGDLPEVTLEQVNALIAPDEERITKEITALRNKFRPQAEGPDSAKT